MSIDADLLLQSFVAEGEEILNEMEQCLLSLEERPNDRETLQTLFRGAHTIKGNASCVGLEAIAAMTHRVEDFLEQWKDGTRTADQLTITRLLAIVDIFRVSVRRAASREDFVPASAGEMIDALRAGSDAAAALEGTSRSEARALRTAATIRVETMKLDRLLDVTGEISIARGRFKRALEIQRASAALTEPYGDIERLCSDLQDLLMKLRMIPIGPFFRQYTRTVRDLAAATGKHARLILEGEDVEVDLSIIEHLRNPLTHMLRNAIDHGIEAPEKRSAAGKPEFGCITIAAHRDAGTIVIKVSDDGAGLDRQRIAARARQLGIDADKLTDPELCRLIFMPGFSTASEVTAMSGRGIGMDVVRRNIEHLHGSVSVESNGGTTVMIRLPLTLAIIDGFVVSAGPESYIVPVESIVECVDYSHRGQATDREFGVASVRGEPVPFIRLRNHFRLDEGDGSRENLVIVTSDGRRAGLVVDRLVGQQQIVIKPLGKLFQKIVGFAGSAVLGSGRVAIVLDVPALLERAIVTARAGDLVSAQA